MKITKTMFYIGTLSKTDRGIIKNASVATLLDYYMKPSKKNTLVTECLPIRLKLPLGENMPYSELFWLIDTQLFKNTDTEELIENKGLRYHLLDKDALIMLIDHYRKRIIEKHKRLLANPEQQAHYINEQLDIWESNESINTDDIPRQLTNSFKDDKLIFELLHILKEHDFKHNDLILYTQKRDINIFD